MIPAPDTLTTERLVLRRPLLDDAGKILHAYARDPDVTRYLTWRPDQTSAKLEEFIQRALANWQEGTSYAWTVTLKEEGQVIGMIDIRMGMHANLGYVLAKPFWNRGYMTEAVRAISSWALQQQDITRVWAVCDVENIASVRVLEKAGFEREGILEKWTVLPNRGSEPRDCFCYGKLKKKEGADA
jgi:RimJ/RimL family protein N-acetyltransferase